MTSSSAPQNCRPCKQSRVVALCSPKWGNCDPVEEPTRVQTSAIPPHLFPTAADTDSCISHSFHSTTSFIGPRLSFRSEGITSALPQALLSSLAGRFGEAEKGKVIVQAVGYWLVFFR